MNVLSEMRKLPDASVLSTMSVGNINAYGESLAWGSLSARKVSYFPYFPRICGRQYQIAFEGPIHFRL